jgi:hypothetical protein
MEKVVMIKCGGYVLCLALGHVFNTILGAAFVTFIGQETRSMECPI